MSAIIKSNYTILASRFPSKDFQFNLFFFRKGEKVPPLHYNRLKTVEIGYIFSGKGRYFINDRLYDIVKGSIFLINDNDLHSLRSRNTSRMHLCFSTKFLNRIERLTDYSFNHLFQNRSTNFRHYLIADYETTSQIEFLLRKINAEIEKKAINYKTMVMLILAQVLFLLDRTSQRKQNNTATSLSSRSQVLVKIVCEYIDNHLSDVLDLTELSKQVSLSPFYLCRIFKYATGLNVSRYIKYKRIGRAKTLLEETNDKVIDIAFNIGFNDLAHFNRSFKEVVGISPSLYRKSVTSTNRGYHN